MMLMMTMMMICTDLMCTGSQLSLAHSAQVKTDMPEKNEKQMESLELVR